MPWITNTTLQEKLNHYAFYFFTCHHCGKESGPVPREFTQEYEKVFTRTGSGEDSVVKLSQLDETVFAQILKSKLLTQVMKAWISAERGEYDWEATCPHCNTKQQWVPKKKLFGKATPVDPHYVPKIDWKWDDIGPEIPAWVQKTKQEKSGFFTSKGLLKADYTDSSNEELNWPFIVPGLRIDFLKDLLGNEHPYEAMKYQTSKPHNAPPLDEGEIAWGFVGTEGSTLVERWVVFKDGFVVRTNVVYPG